MASADSYFLQPFKTHRKKLVPADDETGEVSALEVLARHGSIPKEFEEQIRAL